MGIDDIFSQRKRRWNNLIKMRNMTTANKEYECPKCHSLLTNEELVENKWVCNHCNYYFAIASVDRIEMLCDEGTFRELYGDIKSKDPIAFPDYRKKLEVNRKKTGQLDAVITGTGKINGTKVAIGVLDSRFLMGSMGSVVGEKIARLAEHAGKRKQPLIIFSASGGARMQEGLFSLMQMAKTSAAIMKFRDEGGLFISYLTNPTTGGVSASYASLGDIIIAEPDALICFAGPRVIEQTIGQKLPEGFQHAEFLLEHGMLDMIVERNNMRATIEKILELHRS